MYDYIPFDNPNQDPDLAYAEAQRRIAAWQPGQALVLAIRGLTEIPEEIASLDALEDLQFEHKDLGERLKISDLSVLASLQNLQILNLIYTQVRDLSPLSGLTQLSQLDCNWTQVRDLSPLSGLTQLSQLYCGDTRVSDLTSLSGLTQLSRLDCSYTKVSDLKPIEGLAKIKELSLPHSVPGYPSEVLGRGCADRFYAHVADMQDGREILKDAKLMLLGNGRVGKTEIRKRLLGGGDADFDLDTVSTHGVHIAPTDTSLIDGRLMLWDFGGQDMYHGTHSLFMKSRALFVLCWNPAFEQRLESEPDQWDLKHRNYPLTYWLDFVFDTAGKDAAIVLVQTQCDGGRGQELTDYVKGKLQRFTFMPRAVNYSAKDNTGRGGLDGAIADAYDYLIKPYIGYGRLEAKQRIEALVAQEVQKREAGAKDKRPLIARKDFTAICEQVRAGGKLISNEAMLLRFLHDAGSLYHLAALDQGPADDCIVLDQEWILSVLYELTNREHNYKTIADKGGRFKLRDIQWQEAYSLEQQSQFLALMESCGLIFCENPYDDEDASYVAPDLLPQALEDMEWDEGSKQTLSQAAELDFISPSLIRSIITRFGFQFQDRARYWREGLVVYDRHTKARARVRQVMAEGQWHGQIVLETQAYLSQGDAAGLMATMAQELSELVPGIKAEGSQTKDRAAQETGAEAVQAFLPKSMYFSYAWKDEKDPKREAKVDQLQALAKANGVLIKRDKDQLKAGDSIKTFMVNLAQGERVYVFLSGKYLASSFCMFELASIWDNAKHREALFLDQIRVVILDDANIWDEDSRLDYAVTWAEKIQTRTEKYAKFPNLAATDDGKLTKKLSHFTDELPDILKMFADRIQMSWPEFLAEFEAEVQAAQ